jgi:hypothetical protein
MDRPGLATVLLPAHGAGDGLVTVVRDLPLATVTAPPSQGAAYLAGYRQVLDRGRADLVVTLDATGQHDATQIPHLIDQLLAEDLDVVIGSRWARASGTPGLTLRRWALGRTANLAFRWLTGIAGVTDVTTAGDLERLGAADHFFGWALEKFRSHLRGRVLEVGAGTATITRRLVELDPSMSIVALEPAANVYGDLASFAALTPRVTAARQTLAEYLAGSDELRLAAAALRPGGALLVFGPALEWLYSELDYNAGRYRRYTLGRLRRLVRAAGFEVLSLRYFDVVGVLPYFVAYRLLRRPAISGSTLWGYDRLLVPVSRRLQRAVPHPPLGKNVILVARKAGR